MWDLGDEGGGGGVRGRGGGYGGVEEGRWGCGGVVDGELISHKVDVRRTFAN